MDRRILDLIGPIPRAFLGVAALLSSVALVVACGSSPETAELPAPDPQVSESPAEPDGSGFDPPTARALTAEALAKLEEDPAGAASLLDRALQARPNYLDPLLLKARLATREGRKQEALDRLETIAAMRIDLPFEKDPGLEPLHGEARFDALVGTTVEPRVGSAPAFDLQTLDADLIPESVAYDPVSRRYFLSSVHQRKIVTFGADGDPAPQDFLVDDAESPVFAVLGMAVDAPGRILWAVSCPLPQMRSYDSQEPESGELLGIDLEDGSLRRLVPPAVDGPVRLNDVTVGADGTVYTSSTEPPGRLFRAAGRSPAAALEPFGEPGLRSPQGLALSADSKILFVADYSYGIAAHDTATGRRTWLRPPEGYFLSGIDGLTRVGDALVAIQNGIRPHRVLRLHPVLHPDLSQGRFDRADILDMGLPSYSEPTLGTWVPDEGSDDGAHSGRFIYVANSQWDRFDAENRLPDPSELRPPLLLALPLAVPSPATGG